jgi:site-specific recombinase XerD
MMAKSGIAIGARRHGPHSLRSSLATNMVNSGVPYEAVRKVLGHSSKDAIEHYAKIDVANLRRCSLEPIAPSGLFAEEIA